MIYSLSTITRKTIDIFRAIGDVTDTVRSWVTSISPDLSGAKDIENLINKMKECLNPKGGEATARDNSISLGNLYINLSSTGKYKFLKLLAEEFDIDEQNIEEKILNYKNNTDKNLASKLRLELLKSLEAPRLKILRQFISLPEGLKFIVDMRSDVITLRKENIFLTLEMDLRNILASWFDVGLLDLKRITWNSKASLLEKLIYYEAVHKISSWKDLKKRLDSDRRCFAFFHHKIPDEPLIFVEVALTETISNNIQILLDQNVPTKDSQTFKTAIFYSISNTQTGLAGINLGNFLIKRVVHELSAEFKDIKTYATISPIPGFLQWLNPLLHEQNSFDKLNSNCSAEQLLSSIENNTYTDKTKNALLKLCAYYLVKVKKNNKAFDPVAHFHLSNGATIKKLNWMADISEKGLKESAGIMVNYHYELGKIENNHENYIVNKKINCTKEILTILKK